MANSKVNTSVITELELELLIKAIYQRYGFDFQHYKQASLKRRITLFIEQLQLNSLSELIPKILWDPTLFDKFLQEISVPVTEFFRDPIFYQHVSEKIIPVLKTYPKLRIWIIGCATGEEAYSLAIMLSEVNIPRNYTIYASDMNPKALVTAQQGIYLEKQIQQGENNYRAYTTQGNFLDYFEKKTDGYHIKAELQSSIHFFEHNLIHAEPMSDLQLIFCRNVFIYLDRSLQLKSTQLFFDSLLTGGYLALGVNETLSHQFIPNYFEVIDESMHIYRKWPKLSILSP